MKERLKHLAKDEGAAAVGVASAERLAGMASMDPNYVLQGARSIVSLMLPLDGNIIRRYLAKEDHPGLQKHETEVYRKLYSIGRKVAAFLESEGYRAVSVEPNLDYRFKSATEYRKISYAYRQRMMDWLSSASGPLLTRLKRRLVQKFYPRSARGIDWNLIPSFSHRYGAVAAGLGNFGWSGNVLHPDYGARVLFDTVITDAELESDPIMEETPCDGCRYCARVCQSGFIHMTDKTEVTIAGKTSTHNRKAHNLRCILVCAGFSGQNLHKGWSTWSPGRITLPEKDEDIERFWDAFAKENAWKHNYSSKVMSDLIFHTEYGFIRKPKDRFMTTCGFCQFVCSRTRKERKENYEIILEGGEVAEGPNFRFKVLRSGKIF